MTAVLKSPLSTPANPPASPPAGTPSNSRASNLAFTGVTTEVCVQTSMRQANDRGYVCAIVKDATASCFPEFKRVALDMLTAQGAIVGWCCDSAVLLKALPPA